MIVKENSIVNVNIWTIEGLDVGVKRVLSSMVSVVVTQSASVQLGEAKEMYLKSTLEVLSLLRFCTARGRSN